MGLFANTSGLGETSILSNITAVTGTGYSSKTLTDANWTVSNPDATYAAVDFTATAGDWDNVYGYYIFTTGTTPKLLHFEVSGSNTAIASGETYRVTLTNTAD